MSNYGPGAKYNKLSLLTVAHQYYTAQHKTGVFKSQMFSFIFNCVIEPRKRLQVKVRPKYCK